MYKDKYIAAVIPCYNEEKQIGKVIATMPDFVDKLVIIDDQSTDTTVAVVEHCRKTNGKIVLLKHETNQGVGGAIASGYKWCRGSNVDVAVVMAGDAQMDPRDLPAILDPVVEGSADYSKGNRLFTGEAYKKIPKVRFYGNAILSMLTKIASGYWHVADSQSGYTAINKKALQTINWDEMYKNYGQPNDLLVKLNVYNFRVRDVAINPIYNNGEKSSLKIYKVVLSLSWLLVKLFVYRLKEKYIIRNFHPLVFFYFTGAMSFFISFLLLLRLFYYFFFLNFRVPDFNFLTWMLSLLMSIQFTLFAMWFDKESNKDLR
ncbi:glycosyltransferase family 2 protein [candidate division KSB1 bacterium]|nr:glycosyltransferase family 2 protein [candidate division KSB1 bacterium]